MSLAAEAVALTRELVSIDSVNPALVPGAAGERAVVARLAARLRPRGFGVEIVGPPDRPSLLATARGSGGGPSLALSGHLDTVGVGAMRDPFGARVAGGHVYGRGACDMKAGVAGMVVAAEHAAGAGTAGEVILALAADEEHGSIGTEAILARLCERGALPDACVVGEPTWLDLVVAHRGFAVVEVELRGRAAHTSRPHEGVNAVAHLGRLLAAVEARDAVLAARDPHPHAGVGSLQATVASGGQAPFVVPAAARAVVERRTLPGEPPGAAAAEVREIVAGMASQDPSVRATSREVLARDAWEIAAGDPTAERLMTLLDGALARAGRAPERTGAPYWMESALWQAAGVPAVVCGPAGGGLHTDEEWVEIAQVEAYATALAEVITGFCASAG